MNQLYSITANGVALADGHLVKFGDLPPASELSDAAAELIPAGDAHKTLHRAVLAFESGGASYANCLVNVRDLHAGLRESARALARLFEGVGTFFADGRGPFHLLPPDARLALAVDVVRELLRRRAEADRPPRALRPLPAEPAPDAPPVELPSEAEANDVARTARLRPEDGVDQPEPGEEIDEAPEPDDTRED